MVGDDQRVGAADDSALTSLTGGSMPGNLRAAPAFDHILEKGTTIERRIVNATAMMEVACFDRLFRSPVRGPPVRERGASDGPPRGRCPRPGGVDRTLPRRPRAIRSGASRRQAQGRADWSMTEGSRGRVTCLPSRATNHAHGALSCHVRGSRIDGLRLSRLQVLRRHCCRVAHAAAATRHRSSSLRRPRVGQAPALRCRSKNASIRARASCADGS